jgi:hypothetical protein
MSEVMIVDPNEYKIEPQKAQELIGNLPFILRDRDPLAQEYERVVALNIEDEETSKKARELRMKIRDNRTKGIEAWHKNTKDFFLKGGQFVDAIKRMQSSINLGMEEKLEEIERYFENKEKERKEKLKNERIEVLQPFSEFVPMGINFGEINEDEFQKIFNGSKLQKEADDKRKEEEAEAERQRIEQEKEAERERIIEEQKKLAEKAKKDALEAQKRKAKEREDKIKADAEKAQIALKEEAARKEREAWEREDKIRKDAEAEKQRIIDEQNAKEQARIDALEAQKRKAKEREERIRKEAEAEKQRIIDEQNAKEQARLDAIEAERKAKELAEENARIERERAQKNEKFKKFLADNNFDSAKMEWKQNGSTFEIWTLPKKVAEITI